MKEKRAKRYLSRIVFCMLFVLCMMLSGGQMAVLADSGIHLSASEKKVVEGQVFTITLKGVALGDKSNKLKWRVSNEDVLTIRKRKGDKVTVKAMEDGISKLCAVYKGKKYQCRISVRGRYDSEWPGEYSDCSVTGNKDGASKASSEPTLNAKEIALHYISDYAVPYIGKNPKYLYSFQFKVSGAKSSSVKWAIEGDRHTKSRYRIDDNGNIYMFMGNGYGEEVTECKAVAILPDGTRLKAKVRGYDDENIYIDSVMKKFKETYITSEMSEYDKMDKVAWYLSSEYDYELYQPSWIRYIITGSGDCMASRWAVMYFCRYLGLRAAACPDLDSHGMTVVRADGKVYVVTTGFGGKKPRYYNIIEITRETFDRINEKNNISPDYIWGE